MESLTYELNNYETLIYNYGKQGGSNTNAFCFLESKTNGKELNRDIVFESLKYLQNRHPFLRAYPDESSEDGSVHLKIRNENDCSNQIDLDWIEVNLNLVDPSTEIIGYLEKYTCKEVNYQPDRLLWNYQVISYKKNNQQEYCLSINVPQFQTDGLNICTLLIESINIINSLLTSSICEEMKTKLELAGNLHELCDKSNFIGDVQKETVRKMNEQPIVKFLFPDNFSQDTESGSGINLLKLVSDFTSKLIRKAKEKKVRLNSYLTSAIFYSIHKFLKQNDREFPEQVLCFTPVNLRFRYKENLSFEHMGAHSILIFAHLDESKSFGKFEDVWKDSEIINEEITAKTNIEQGNLFFHSHSPFLMNNRITRHLTFSHESVLTDCAISNIGTYINDRVKVEDGPWNVREIYFGDYFNTYPCLYSKLITYIIYWRGELMIRLSTNKRDFAPNYAKQFIDLLKQTFEESLV